MKWEIAKCLVSFRDEIVFPFRYEINKRIEDDFLAYAVYITLTDAVHFERSFGVVFMVSFLSFLYKCFLTGGRGGSF